MQGKEFLTIQKAKAPSRKKEYNEISLELRKDAIRQSAISNKELLHIARKRGKVDLMDTEQVEKAIDEYFLFESERGNVPNFEALCCFMGLSSAWVYEFLVKHHRESSAEVLELAKQSMVANRINLADAKVIAETFSIFILKNSRAGYSDKYQVDATATPADPLEEYRMTEEQLRKKYADMIAALPDPDDEY